MQDDFAELFIHMRLICGKLDDVVQQTTLYLLLGCEMIVVG